MRTTSTERMQIHRERKRLGQQSVRVLVSDQELDYLMANGYQLSRVDRESIGRAVSQFISDTAIGLA
jgi:hypothetical protein